MGGWAESDEWYAQADQNRKNLELGGKTRRMEVSAYTMMYAQGSL